MKKTEQAELCLCGCQRPAMKRGLSLNCYQSAARLVRLKKTTWKKLENLGAVKPVNRGGPFARHLAALSK